MGYINLALEKQDTWNTVLDTIQRFKGSLMLWGTCCPVIECNCVFYSCLGKADLWFNLVQVIFQHSTAALHPPDYSLAGVRPYPGCKSAAWALSDIAQPSQVWENFLMVGWKGFKRETQALDQNFQQVHAERELQSRKDFKEFPVWWHIVDIYIIRSPKKMTHMGPTRTENKVWGCSLNFGGCANGMKGFRQGRRNGYESQDVLSRWALGNVPPMPVPPWSREVEEVCYFSQKPSCLLADASHPCPVSCDLGEVSGYPGLLSLGHSNNRVWNTEVVVLFLPLPTMML